MTIEYTKNYHHLTRIATFCALLYCNTAFSAELVEYDHTFLMGQNASNIDLSRYSEGNPAIPGVYDVSVYVNDQPIINQSITFVAIEGKKGNDSNLLIVFYVQIMPDDFVMQLHRF
ncbi:outer membrane usher protein [Escherichia coli]|nr:outer membrane usher protein [Escherichia coli]